MPASVAAVHFRDRFGGAAPHFSVGGVLRQILFATTADHARTTGAQAEPSISLYQPEGRTACGPEAFGDCGSAPEAQAPRAERY
jgi:hypothetical protein